jgi:multidrug resistance protein MdtO
MIGILLALVVMAFVFDRIWPVRTVTGMRTALAFLLRAAAAFLRLPQTSQNQAELFRHAEDLRDQVGKTVAGIRTMNDTIDYEFGVDRQLHAHAGQTVLHAALTMVAFFWNQFAVLHNEQDSDFHTEPSLQHLRSVLADCMETMAKAVLHNTEFAAIHPENLIDHSLLGHQRYGEYVRNSIARFDELQRIVAQLRTQPVRN